MEKIKSTEKDFKKNIQNAFNQIETDYQNAKSNYDGYVRSDFYNDIRLNMEMSLGKIEFVNSDEIDIEKLYDTNGVKIESFPNSNISNNTRIEEGKNYILRAEYGMENINFYYIINLSENGLNKIEWVCFTEGEYISDETLEETDLEENYLREGEI